MKVKLTANAELDLLTQQELGQELEAAAKAWRKELSRGVRFVKFSAQTNVATGVWTILPEAGDNRLGPAEGFVWSVTRLSVAGNGFTIGTDAFHVYVSEVTPSKLAARGSNPIFFDPAVLVLMGGEDLAFSGAGTNVAGTDVHVSGQAIELPAQLAWQLL